MTRLLRVALSVVGALALTVLPAQAQNDQITVDAELAKRGKSLWLSRGCEGCHSIGKGARSGPDLAGVLDRRPVDWLRRWIKDPDEMMDTDSLGMALLAEFNNTRMPNMRLRDRDVEALLHHIANRTAELASGGQ